MENFGNRLRRALKLRGMSQPGLAKAMGLSPGSISDMLKRPEASKYVVQLADVLGVTPHWLALGTGPMEAVLGSRYAVAPSPALGQFAERLSRARRDRGFATAEAAARSSDLDGARWLSIERGEYEPTVAELLAIRAVLDVSLDYLLAGELPRVSQERYRADHVSVQEGPPDHSQPRRGE